MRGMSAAIVILGGAIAMGLAEASTVSGFHLAWAVGLVLVIWGLIVWARDVRPPDDD
jgi:hypothetical protein